MPWRLAVSRGPEAGRSKTATDRFGYSAFVYVGDTDEEGVRVGSKLALVNTSMTAARPRQPGSDGPVATRH